MSFKPIYIICPECNKTFRRSLKYTFRCSEKCKSIHHSNYIKKYHLEYIKRPGVKSRMNIIHKNFIKKNIEKKRIWNKNWVNKNRERIKQINNKYNKKRKLTLKYIIDSRMGTRLRSVILKNNVSWESILGYTNKDLEKHLFENNDFLKKDFLNKKFHIDHKTPLSWFKYDSPQDKNFKIAWSLENLQLLSKHENNKKHNSYCSDVLLALTQL